MGLEDNLSQGRQLPHTITGSMISPLVLPLHKQYYRLPVLDYNSSSRSQKNVHLWRLIVGRLSPRRKCKVGDCPKRSAFHYDADSYALNFDDCVRRENPTNSIHDEASQKNHKIAHESSTKSENALRFPRLASRN